MVALPCPIGLESPILKPYLRLPCDFQARKMQTVCAALVETPSPPEFGFLCNGEYIGNIYMCSVENAPGSTLAVSREL